MSWFVAPENDYAALEPVAEPSLRVAVVIPVYNRVGLLSRTVAGLACQSYPADLLQVIVADDGSEEDVQAALDPLADQLDLSILRREHDGYGAGQARNLGASEADADVLVFVDADCLPDEDLVRSHAAWHSAADNLVVIGSRHHLDTSDLTIDALAAGRGGLRQRTFGGAELPGEELVPDDWRRVLYRRTTRLRHGDEAYRTLVSSNFSVRRERFDAAGGFDTSFTRWGGEDTELGWRLQQSGCFFVPEDRAIVYHQMQQDEGDPGWRQASRALNEGRIRTKIPHRFYRDSRRGYIYENPKVSVVVDPADPDRVRELLDGLLRQNLTDWEVTFVGEGDALTVLGEELAEDPRIALARTLEAAADGSTGEFLCLLHGSVSLDHRFLSRAAKQLDRRPRSSLLRAGYQLPGSGRQSLHLGPSDVAELDQAWRPDGLPLAALVRRREWAKAGGICATPADRWSWIEANGRTEHLRQPLVGVPGPVPSSDPTPPEFLSPRSAFVRDVRRASGPADLVGATRAFVSRRFGAGEPPPAPATRSRQSEHRSDGGDRRVHTRYIGWTGQDNLGDEALLEAIETLLPWADLATKGEPRELLLLGGGTLINRGYLKELDQWDSPRVERAVFGTGVANPAYWGEPRERPQDWVDFLSTCCYVGVRGPISEELLRGWGHSGRLEVIGDPALALTAPDVDRRPDRVVISVANARGELWGSRDELVFEALGDFVGSLVAEGRDVHLIGLSLRDDHPGLQVMRRAGAPDLPYLAGYGATQESLSLLASASVVVGERLHALVLAAACGTPFVGLEYRPKIRDFARSVDMEDLIIRTDEVSPDGLRSLLGALEGRYAEFTTSMDDHVSRYRQRLRTAAAELEEMVR